MLVVELFIYGDQQMPDLFISIFNKELFLEQRAQQNNKEHNKELLTQQRAHAQMGRIALRRAARAARLRGGARLSNERAQAH